ncbi:CobW family GTP-binding protein [Dehalobacterium formicoaceticum]|uniref:CobW family GTP-binding protein n=1 Tax=Dehalobacterium formicoaceticum TaxID=51515 RepID=UPI000B7FB992|nr:GTP-binding protein [Dehalobacterium formicoaceticum]
MTEQKPIQLFLVTGFLGSGKTTLMNNILDDLAARNIKAGVIVNEWGQVGIDGSLFHDHGFEIQELNNGQIFCSCLAGNFVDALVRFADYPLDYLLVETSGMANPQPIRQMLKEIRSQTGERYDYRGTLNPNAPIVETSFTKVEGLLDLDLMNQERSLAVRRSVKTPYKRPVHYVVSTKENVDPAQAAEFAKRLLNHAFRIKGFIHNGGEGWFYLDAVNDQVEIKPVQAKGNETKIVVISKVWEEILPQIESAWQETCGVPFEIK